jgi:hypothetical protein
MDSQGIDPLATCDQWDVKQMLSSQCCQQLSAAANNIYYVFCVSSVFFASCAVTAARVGLAAANDSIAVADKIYFVFCPFLLFYIMCCDSSSRWARCCR